MGIRLGRIMAVVTLGVCAVMMVNGPKVGPPKERGGLTRFALPLSRRATVAGVRLSMPITVRLTVATKTFQCSIMSLFQKDSQQAIMFYNGGGTQKVSRANRFGQIVLILLWRTRQRCLYDPIAVEN